MLRVSLKQMSIFDAVARYENHTKAAEKLHMTQPAVSMQMKQMESYLNIRLFERRGRSITLTRAAQELRKYTADIMHSCRRMEEHLERLKGGQQGHLVVSVTTTANHFISRILSEFSKLYPEVKISLDVTNRQNILTQLNNYEPDHVVMGEPPKGLDLDSETFMENPLVLIAPPDHPLCGKKNLCMDDLLQEKFVSRERGSGTREAIERHFKKSGKSCVSSLEMSSNEAIKHAVAAGFGLGIVSLHTIALELQNDYLKVLDVEGFPILRHWHLVTRKRKTMSPVAETFRSFLLEEAKNFV
ncbi:MAG TPA: LysR family transcriptional regulator [Gammaproteobacteria bacterium]|nr:LysR family transcriptional regulator [Gammaproteobacteria bacterium]